MSYKVYGFAFGFFFALAFGMISGCSNPADSRWEKVRENQIAWCNAQRWCEWGIGVGDCEELVDSLQFPYFMGLEVEAMEKGCEEELEAWIDCKLNNPAPEVVPPGECIPGGNCYLQGERPYLDCVGR